MGAVKELWMAEYEAIYDDLAKDGDEDRARERMKKLGFDPEEIDDHIAEWKR